MTFYSIDFAIINQDNTVFSKPTKISRKKVNQMVSLLSVHITKQFVCIIPGILQ